MTINLCQLWQYFDDDLSVILLSTERIVTQPQNPKLLEAYEVLYFSNFADIVLSKIQLLDLEAAGKMLKRIDPIDGHGHNFEVRHLPDE
jgi:hypothetical protein